MVFVAEVFAFHSDSDSEAERSKKGKKIKKLETKVIARPGPRQRRKIERISDDIAVNKNIPPVKIFYFAHCLRLRDVKSFSFLGSQILVPRGPASYPCPGPGFSLDGPVHGYKKKICCVYLNKHEYEVQPNSSLNCTNTTRLSTLLILLRRHWSNTIENQT